MARAHGVRGEIRVTPFISGERLPPNTRRIRLVSGNELAQILELEGHRTVPGALLIKLKGISDRDSAQEWQQARLEVSAEDIPPSEPGEYYLFEVVGAELEDENGSELGHVERIESGPEQDLAVIRQSEREKRLPLVPEIVRRYHRERRVLEVKIPPGLWDD